MKKKMYKINLLMTLVFMGVFVLSVQAEEKQKLDEIVGNVMKASISNEAYQVRVIQTVLKGKVTLSSTRFLLIYDPGKGAYTTKHESELTSEMRKAVVRVRVDIGKLLKELQLMEDITIDVESLNGRITHRISGKHSNGTGVTLWVNVDHWYIAKAIIYILGNEFSETTFHYRSIKDIWVPSKIVINHPNAGVSVLQDFTDYEFF